MAKVIVNYDGNLNPFLPSDVSAWLLKQIKNEAAQQKYHRAIDIVSKMSLEEQANLTSGVVPLT